MFLLQAVIFAGSLLLEAQGFLLPRTHPSTVPLAVSSSFPFLLTNTASRGRLANSSLQLASQQVEEDVCDIANGDYNLLVEEMAESVDLTRETTRVESLSSYVVVSCLTATASFNTIQQLALDPDPTSDVLFLHMSGLVISALSTLAGIYSTVVFSLCTAYGLASLGMGRDNLYDKFMEDSQSLRYKGFQSYLLSLGLFLVELTVVTSERLTPMIRYPFLFSFTILTIVAVRDWNKIVDLARAIFAPTVQTGPRKGNNNDSSSQR